MTYKSYVMKNNFHHVIGGKTTRRILMEISQSILNTMRLAARYYASLAENGEDFSDFLKQIEEKPGVWRLPFVQEIFVAVTVVSQSACDAGVGEIVESQESFRTTCRILTLCFFGASCTPHVTQGAMRCFSDLLFDSIKIVQKKENQEQEEEQE